MSGRFLAREFGAIVRVAAIAIGCDRAVDA